MKVKFALREFILLFIHFPKCIRALQLQFQQDKLIYKPLDLLQYLYSKMRESYKFIISLVCFIISAVSIAVCSVYLPLLVGVVGFGSSKTTLLAVACFLGIFIVLTLGTFGYCIHLMRKQYRVYRLNQEDPVARHHFSAGIV